MNDLLQQERTLLSQIESSFTSTDDEERKRYETQLDTVRESIESYTSPMDIVSTYLSHHESTNSWKRIYRGKGFTNAQSLIATLMDRTSPLKSILLYHGVGVGKTCAAIAAASSYKDSKQIIVLTPSDTLVKNWR